MSKTKKKSNDTGRAEERLWRIHQRAHKFTPATAYNRKDKSWRNE